MSEPNVTPDGNAPSSQPTGDGAAGGPAVAVLQDLENLRQERDQFLDMLQRTKADFDNYQKRAQREREQDRRYWHSPLALDLLPVIDNLERATAAAKQANESGPLVQGVAMVLTQLLDLLRRHGITPVEALGKPFDPNQHQAVMQQPSADQPPNTVLQVLERGFMIHDRVLRPAAVVVATPPA